jgi:transcriptional regulator with XRE-family HTH domain
MRREPPLWLRGGIEAIRASVGAQRLRQGQGRALRTAAGLSVRQLAKELDVDAATLSRWERGEARPRPSSAARWVAACQVIEHEIASTEDNDPGAATPGSSESVAATQLPARDSTGREAHETVT